MPCLADAQGGTSEFLCKILARDLHTLSNQNEKIVLMQVKIKIVKKVSNEKKKMDLNKIYGL